MKSSRLALRWVGIVVSVFAGLSKASEGKSISPTHNKQKHEDGKVHLQEVDVLGEFRLGYVDCLPYNGADQIIEIHKEGHIERIDRTAKRNKKVRGDGAATKDFGRLKTGSLLKGEIVPAEGFQTLGQPGADLVSQMKIQLVSMPGGTGVWFTMSGIVNGKEKLWDEIYVREPDLVADEVLV